MRIRSSGQLRLMASFDAVGLPLRPSVTFHDEVQSLIVVLGPRTRTVWTPKKDPWAWLLCCPISVDTEEMTNSLVRRQHTGELCGLLKLVHLNDNVQGLHCCAEFLMLLEQTWNFTFSLLLNIFK